MDVQDARAFIEDQFSQAGIFYRTLKADLAISCPFHEHSGRKQLLNVKMDGSAFHCWSCNAKGHWNQLADKLGLKRLPDSVRFAYGQVDRELDQAVIPRAKPRLPEGLEPWDRPWRGLEPDFLARFQAARWFDPKSQAYRILWPVRYNGTLQGYVAGRTDDQTQPKYRNGPVGFQTRRALWPIDDEAVKRVVVLTEGPFSALRLLREGIPAVATLGATNWSPAKTSMLRLRRWPARVIVLAFDGDDTGWAATQRVWRELAGQFDAVVPFELPDGRDPGDCSDKTLDRLRGTIRQAVADVRGRANSEVVRETR
jgi:DNA primase